MYSRELAWGYFDHPPAIALLIKIGTTFFSGEFGMRFLSVLIGTLSIYIIEKIVEPERPRLFYITVSSVAILHFVGFLAIPDSPLMLFTVSFFWLYKQFLKDASFKWAFLLGGCAALMMLSKYHAVLIIGLIVLSNLRLLTTRNFWVAVGIFLVAISPHIYWQFVNDFVSFKYQLIERAGDPYKIRYTAEYVGTLPFILGPVVSILMIIGTIILPTKNKFEKALKFCFWGVLIFFFFSSFNGWVEAHWILITLAPGLYFGYKLAADTSFYEKVVRIQFWPIIVLILLARFVVAFDILPENKLFHELRKNYHGKEKWASQIQAKAGNRPVIFLNSYKDPSLYTFLTGQESTAFNTLYSRKNQFNIWNYQEDYRGQDVAVIPGYFLNLDDSVITSSKRVNIDFIENYQPITNIWLEPLNLPSETRAGDTLSVKFSLEKTGVVNMDADPEYTCRIIYLFSDESERISRVFTQIEITNSMLDTEFNVPIIIPDYLGEVRFKAGVQSGWIPPGYHSDWKEITINARP